MSQIETACLKNQSNSPNCCQRFKIFVVVIYSQHVGHFEASFWGGLRRKPGGFSSGGLLAAFSVLMLFFVIIYVVNKWWWGWGWRFSPVSGPECDEPIAQEFCIKKANTCSHRNIARLHISLCHVLVMWHKAKNTYETYRHHQGPQ